MVCSRWSTTRTRTISRRCRPARSPTPFSIFRVSLTSPPVVIQRQASERDRSVTMLSLNEGRSTWPTIDIDEILRPGEIRHPARPTYRGEVNAFALEIFATKDHIEQRWVRNFLEAAFECLPDLDYCAILIPFSHSFLPFLEYFVVGFLVERTFSRR